MLLWRIDLHSGVERVYGRAVAGSLRLLWVGRTKCDPAFRENRRAVKRASHPGDD
jgi:hypothetical protein